MKVVNRIFWLLLLMSGCTQQTPVSIAGVTMGTTYQLKIVGQVEVVSLQLEIEAELERINNLMSTYLSESEISRFNRSTIDEPFELAEDNVKLLGLAFELFALSDGKFDVTVGPLVNLWGFGPGSEQTLLSPILPSEAKIAASLRLVGMDELQLDGNKLTRGENIYLDLSAIAKGYAVDRLAALLDSHGFEHYLVEIGGELRARGENHHQRPWRIAIEKPDAGQRAIYRAIELGDMGMATSGDYRNFFEIDGERFSHTIDPTTGNPVNHNLVSVTVIATTAALADGFATAINVMGADAGLALADQQNLAVLVIMNEQAGLEERFSKAFEPYLVD
ncbi:MAG: FAD:protein FMN transferase [Pseudomonadales bacterium]|nr:FAD:protein FMN transferase [Pseudomonadales bacterium]